MEETPSQSNGLDSKAGRLDLLPFFQMIWKWKFALLGVLIISMVSAYLLVKQIDKLYESHAILYPANSSSRDKQLEEFSYGYDVQSERLVQLLNSQHLMDSLVRRFDLANTYNIDMSRKDGLDRLITKARTRFQFHKTRFTSVVISVQDEDPEKAAAMANEAARLVNVVQAVVMKENAITALEAAEREYKKRTQEISVVNDSIQVMQDLSMTQIEGILRQRIKTKEERINRLRAELGEMRKDLQIYDYGNQVNILNQEIAKAQSTFLQEEGRLDVLLKSRGESDSLVISAKANKAGAKKRLDHFQDQLNRLSAVNDNYLTTQDHLEDEKALLLQAKSELDELTGTLEPEISVRSLSELESNYDWDQVQLRELQRNYQRALANYLDPVPVAYVISEAKPSYRAIYPKVFSSVLLAGLGALSFAMVVITFIERSRKQSS